MKGERDESKRKEIVQRCKKQVVRQEVFRRAKK